MPKLKLGTIIPGPDEDAAITAAANADSDARPYTDEEWARVRPQRGRGRPSGSGQKEQVTLRVDSEVLDSFRSGGAGWQTRMNEALKEWLATHGRG
jgi:uncharacterized protein (DUF4415 family)